MELDKAERKRSGVKKMEKEIAIKNSLKINQSVVYLNGKEIPQCTSVTIKGIGSNKPMEATITITVDEAKIMYRV